MLIVSLFCVKPGQLIDDTSTVLEIFGLTKTQSTLLQFAYFIGEPIVALVAGRLLRHSLSSGRTSHGRVHEKVWIQERHPHRLDTILDRCGHVLAECEVRQVRE